MFSEILGLIIFGCIGGFSLNNTAELISTYAKVARWGATELPKAQLTDARSSGQRLWTQRSDVNIRGGQNMKKQPITYYYNIKPPSSKIDETKLEPIPSKGEVQERFNPRPYFDFVFDNPPRSNQQPDSSANVKQTVKHKAPSIVYGTPVGSLPRPESDKTPADTYGSPFNSYNPPPPDTKSRENIPAFDFPPNESKPPPVYGPPSLQSDSSEAIAQSDADDTSFAVYNHPKDIDGSNGNSLPFHPPLVPSEGHNKEPEGMFFQPTGAEISNSYFATPQTAGGSGSDEGKPNHQNYFQSSDYGPPISQTVEPPVDDSPYFDQPPKSPSMAEDDLSPPPADVAYGQVPDFYHFGHHHPHIYHEIHHTTSTTTTTEAPRAGHYSYYYLGRKLWYIPLYFSVYFIVYVTILILKSIARHKIQFSHNFDKGRNSRELDLNIVNETVTNAIENVRNKYM